MEKNQIYKAFQQERYQIEERLSRLKEEIDKEKFSGSWNDLTDKPFGNFIEETREIVFAEKTVVVSNAQMNPYGESFVLPDIGNYVLTKDGEEYPFNLSYSNYHNNYRVTWLSDKVLNVQYPGAMSKPTIYIKLENGQYTIMIEKVGESIGTKTLDEKFIPDSIARKSDLENISTGVTSWNDLSDRPFYTVEGTQYTGTIENGTTSILIDKKYIGCECTIAYSGDSKYTSWSGNFILGSRTISKLDPSVSVDFVYDEEGIHCNISMNTDATGDILVTISSKTVCLDESYIPESIARTSQLPSKVSELENDTNYQTSEQVQEVINNHETSWNDLTEKPFYSEKVNKKTQYDGTDFYITDGVVELSRTIDLSPLINKKIELTIFPEGGAPGNIYHGTAYEYVDYLMGPFIYLTIDEDEDFVWKQTYDANHIDTFENFENIFVSTGPFSMVYISIIEKTENIKTLDEQFIPDTIARASQIPTKISQLTNDSGYQNAEQVQSIVNTAIGNQTHFTFEKVNTLPEIGKENVIYLVPDSANTESNSYLEYLYLSSTGKYELIGSTQIDLSGYALKSEMFSGSWNDLTEKPFEEKIISERSLIYETTITPDETGNDNFIVSDIGFKLESILGKYVAISVDGIESVGTVIFDEVNADYKLDSDKQILVQSALYDNICQIYQIEPEYGVNYNLKIEEVHENLDIKCLDKKFIPDDIDVSWNNMKDKPFDEYFENIREEAYSTQIHTVMGEIYEGNLDFTLANLVGKTIYISILSDNYSAEYKGVVVDDSDSLDTVYTVQFDEDYGIYWFEENGIQHYEQSIFNPVPDGYHTFKIEAENSVGIIKPIDEKFIPDTIARKSDLESISSQIPSQTSDLENDSNYISKAELQNILNQIEVTTAEDGTVEIHIPTIS